MRSWPPRLLALAFVVLLLTGTSCEEESSVPVTQLSPTTTSLSASTVTDETTSAGQLLWLSSGLPICRSFPGLSKEQLDLCHRHPEITSAAVQGLQLAVHECQFQFQWNRWNCSSLNTKNRNPHSSVLLKRGYRESAFAYAISSAGVAHSVARACSQGRLLECGCGPGITRAARRKAAAVAQLHASGNTKHQAASVNHRWKWGGCSHNLEFGVHFSKLFIDSREKAGDIQSRINLHNNQAGRLIDLNNMCSLQAVSTNTQVRCKCHGMSGSCELKTCWKAAPDFRLVGERLKSRFRSALLVDQSNLNSGSPILQPAPRNNGRGLNARRGGKKNSKRRSRRKTKNKNGRNGGGRDRGSSGSNTNRGVELDLELFYYQRSPNFCERDSSVDFPGTQGRECHRSGTGPDGCASLCCGRGYNVIRQRRLERCQCRFHWCCYVVCQNCTVEEWITVCK